VISFAQIYRKTERNMNAAAKEFGFNWDEHQVEGVFFIAKGRALASELAQIATSYGMRLKVCSQPAFLMPGLIKEARCVDAERLERVAQRAIPGKVRQKHNRKECGCFISKDIGEYDTCPHGCIYCYAVQQRDLALNRYKEHDPQGEFLFAPRVKSNKHERPHGLPYRFLILVQINRTNRPSVKEGPRSREETRDPPVEVPAGRLRGFDGIACGSGR
jgi:Domain of unknown function (DUF1848)